MAVSLRFVGLLAVAASFGGLGIAACGTEDLGVDDSDAAVADAHVDAPSELADSSARDASPDAAGHDAAALDASASDADAALACDAGLVACGACIDPTTDPDHCGTCEHACAATEVCTEAACAAGCLIEGARVPAGTADPGSACQACDPAVSTSDWSPRADGTACGAGSVCSAAACTAGCFIDGAFVAAGAVDPQNACQVCAPDTSTTTWSPRGTYPLLVGGTDVTAQGWSTITQSPQTLSYAADTTVLSTSTPMNGQTSGQLLLVRAGAFDATKPFAIRVVVKVQTVGLHNLLDSGAAILGSFTNSFGNSTDRSQMIYLDATAIGWADDSQSFAMSTTDAFHTYELAVAADHTAQLKVDGVTRLTRTNFVSNGTIAVGDQTNDKNVDGTIAVQSVSFVCQ